MCENRAVRVILSGVYGNLGTQIIREVNKDGMRNFITIRGGLERPNHPQLGTYQLPWNETFPVMSLTKEGRIPPEIHAVDLIVDASSPAVVSVANLKAATDLEIPAVIFSTGHNENHLKHIHRAARRLPCVLWDLPVDSSPAATATAARNAIRAVLWLMNERPRAHTYPMSQILGLKQAV